jgi:Cu+-exporting ATPase
LGSTVWLRSDGTVVPEETGDSGSGSGLVIDGKFRGRYRLSNALRPAVRQLISALGDRYDLTLLSGDQPHEYDAFRKLFGARATLHFNQSPLEKLEYVRRLQTEGRTVLMVGDGLNDAGAFQQSDVSVAVVERIGAFSPASDIILDAEQVPALADLPRFARRTVWVVRLSLGLSALYNVVGLSIAAAGLLSPLICAILMPLSSVTVVLFATGATSLAFHRFGLTRGA